MTVLVLFFVATLGISFCCSMMEGVMLSVTHSYIETLIHGQHRSGTVLKQLKDRINRPLAAILTLNTVANTGGAAAVGAQAAELFGDVGMGIASAVLTLGILVCSEVIPKTLGAVYWRSLAVPVSYGIRCVIWMLYPMVLALEAISKRLSGQRQQSRISREEMVATAKIGASEGQLHSQEHRIIQNLLRLHQIRVKDVLTPRSVMVASKKNETVGQFVNEHSPIRFSRIPVYDKDLDDITGVVHRHKVLQVYSKGMRDMSLGELAIPIHAVPETKSVAGTLNEFIRRREHMFLVVDEYGGTAGIITLEDAIETLLGVEIVDESDTVEDMRKLAMQIWEKRKREHEL